MDNSQIITVKGVTNMKGIHKAQIIYDEVTGDKSITIKLKYPNSSLTEKIGTTYIDTILEGVGDDKSIEVRSYTTDENVIQSGLNILDILNNFNIVFNVQVKWHTSDTLHMISMELQDMS